MTSPEEVYKKVQESGGQSRPSMMAMTGSNGSGSGNTKKGQIELPIDDDTLFRLFMLTTVIANLLIIFKR